MNANAFSQKDYENETTFRLEQNKPNTDPIKLEANLPPRGRRSLRVSFSESSNRGPISNAHKPIKGAKKRVSGTFSGPQLPERI